MKIAHRFIFYGIGFIIGLTILFFFLGGKKTSCDYGPDARVLKNIRIKPRVFSKEALQSLTQNGLDTASVSVVLRNGDVDFSESETSKKTCNIYVVTGEVSDKDLQLSVENCENQATILTAAVIE